ncbi:MAG: hypothetical protein GPJ50_02325 [Candidatus Heimdallarchaeota archaeon]|nr:hypothetical protein [Candidatus Heimdallarchaeota archaeon]
MSKKKHKKFLGSNKAIYSIRKGGKVTLYAAFIVKPHKESTEEAPDRRNYWRKDQELNEKLPSVLSILTQVKRLKTSLHRLFLPGNVKRKSQSMNEVKKTADSSLLDQLFEEKNKNINVKLSFYLLKTWKLYDISESFQTIEDLVEDFVYLLRNELKQKLESVGNVGRLLDTTLEELVLYGTLDKSNFLASGKKLFSELTKDYSVIERDDKFHKSFIPGPAVDKRPEVTFSFPTGIVSDKLAILGVTENDSMIGLPENASYPILIAGDKKTREIITCKLLEQNKRFIILDPRMNLEFEDRLNVPFESLNLGENFFLNVLTPLLNEYVPEKLSSQYLGNFIDLVKLISDVRNDGAVLLRDLIDFYANDYHEEQDDILFPHNETNVSLNDLYTMLTVEPGGLVITDYQLSIIRSLINEIRDPSISTDTSVKDKKGLQELFTCNRVINFSSQGYKIQRLFIYSFLLQLSTYDQISKDDEEIIIYIDDAELFFSRNTDKSILAHIIKKLENSRFKVVLSTPYPSHLASQIFDLTYNRIIGNLKSARCVRLISDSHGFGINQVDFIRRLPKNKFMLLREDLTEKPLLLQMLPEDIERHENQPIHRRVRKETEQSRISEKDSEKIRLNYEDFAQLHPIMIDILAKLSSKVNRGINTESIVNIFPKWSKNEVKEAISALEMFGYIFFETVDSKGRKNEYWTKITPRGKKFLDKLKFSKLVDSSNKEVDPSDAEKNEVSERMEEFIESPTVIQRQDQEAGSIIIKKLKVIRKIIRETRDSTDIPYNKLEILNSFLIQVEPLLSGDYSGEKDKLQKFLDSLQNLLSEDKSIESMPQKILQQIFQKSLSIIDAIQIRATYGEETSSSKDEEFINKIIETELGSEKWKDFNRDIFLTEIPELSSISRDKEQILDLLKSEFPEEVLKGLELSSNLPKDEFIETTKKVLASLLQIKTLFFPNMESNEYLDEINSFFKSTGYPEPFEKSQQLLWEYSALNKKESPKSAYTQKSRREIIESIQEETNAFDFDTNMKNKDNLISQLVENIRKRINNA